jgi:hypothetical protein
MKTEKANMLVFALIKPTRETALRTMREIHHGKIPDDPIAQIAAEALPLILKMNSGEAAELLAHFIGAAALEQAKKIITNKCAIQSLIDQLLNGGGPHSP